MEARTNGYADLSILLGYRSFSKQNLVFSNLVDSYLNSNLMVRDRTFYNVGVISYDGEFRMVSVGVLNHVFTVDKETAREFLRGKLKESLPKSDLFKGHLF